MTSIRKAVRIVIAVMREIFDEAAYDRFLHRRQLDSGPVAYAEFWRERETNQAPKPRCC